MSQHQTDTEAYRAIANVVPFRVRDAIGAQIARAADGEDFCLIEARTLARNHCSAEARQHALDVIASIDFDAIRSTATVTPADLVNAHFTDPRFERADWDGLWPHLDADGFILDAVDADSIQLLGLVPVRWNGQALVAGDPEQHADAFAFRASIRGAR